MTGMSTHSLLERIIVLTKWIICWQVMKGSLQEYPTMVMQKGAVEITAINIEEAATRRMKKNLMLPRTVTPFMISCTHIHQSCTKELPLI
jgi:hypothetical protein